jgi:hypothetical protein
LHLLTRVRRSLIAGRRLIPTSNSLGGFVEEVVQQAMITKQDRIIPDVKVVKCKKGFVDSGGQASPLIVIPTACIHASGYNS